jgi:tRNA-Thr(GGU) m(6)t(6)A37 methyltransferase TsaA
VFVVRKTTNHEPRNTNYAKKIYYSMELQPLTIEPIGIIRTPYIDRCDAPRQPGGAEQSAAGKIILLPGKNYEQALEDLEGFEKIWLIYQFHRNTNWKPKILPPRSDRTKRGVFATRSPHRPNPLGLSLLTLIEIDGRNIFVEGVDILDKSPVFDIKPYLPYAEAYPYAKSGWLEEVMAEEALRQPYVFELSALAIEQIQWLSNTQNISLLDTAKRVLAGDPYPHPSRRIFKEEKDAFAIAIKSWRIIYRIDSDRILLDEVRSGYSAEALKKAEDVIHQKQAHLEFHALWGAKADRVKPLFSDSRPPNS